jgi:CRISPR-associated protein Csb3
MAEPGPIRINVTLTNPGQFFACCGLLELADRLWPGAEGWFAEGQLCLSCDGTLPALIEAASHVDLAPLDPEDRTATPIQMAGPLKPVFRLDWWKDERAGGKDLKVWAGTMENIRIARAMQHAMRSEAFKTAALLDIGVVVYAPENPNKKVEPFYFDARRCTNAHSRDVGFAPNDLQLTTAAHPAVEFLALVGLQRCLPAPTSQPRIFEYFTWERPLQPTLIPAAVAGHLQHVGGKKYRFENWYRTGQRKHKAFRSAIPVTEGG